MDAVTVALATQTFNELTKPYEPFVLSTDMTMPTGRSRFAIAKMTNGNILLAGGDGFGLTNENRAEVLDPVAKTWSTRANMSSRRTGPRAAPLSGNRVLVTGGYNGGSQVATTELYDHASNTWTDKAAMTTARQGHICEPLSGDRVLVSTGYLYPNVITASERYDLISNTWTSRSSNSAVYGAHSAPLSGDRVLVSGGLTSQGGSSTALSRVYDDPTNTWTNVATAKLSRSDGASARLKGDRVIVMNGIANAGFAVLQSEIFDYSKNTWELGENNLEHRYAGGGVSLDEELDTVLYIGGCGPTLNPRDRPTVEQYMGGYRKVLVNTDNTIRSLLSTIKSWAAAN